MEFDILLTLSLWTSTFFQAELEEADEKEGSEIDEARSTIADVEKLFQSEDA